MVWVTMYLWYGTWIALLFVITGALMLRYDVYDYSNKSMEREMKAARKLAMFSISFGVLIYIGKWLVSVLLT